VGIGGEGPAVTTVIPDPRRRIVPRWRFLRDRNKAPESAGDPRGRKAALIDPAYVDQKVRDWLLDPGIATAAELVAGANVCGLQDEARSAATYILEHAEQTLPATVASAQKCLGMSPIVLPQCEANVHGDLNQRSVAVAQDAIRRGKRRVSNDARNLEAWLDMSRAYAMLGQQRRSDKCMEKALLVAPNHRIALRSAARLAVHKAEPERAVALLSKHPRTRMDPWLLATEIAVQTIAGRTSNLTRFARAMIEDRRFPDSQLTELHSALATLDYFSGSLRGARKHIRQSLIDPNDNAVAQARWFSARMAGITIAPAAFELATSYEARSWRALANKNWLLSQNEAVQWLMDEPFASRAAVHASFVAVSLNEDYQLGVACVNVGLQADPKNPVLLNNLAVAQAYMGDVAKAEATLNKVSTDFSDDHPEYIRAATSGLVRFRSGDIAAGRKLYEQALEGAPVNMKWLVLAHWVKEELESGGMAAQDVVSSCKKLSELTKDPISLRRLELVKVRAETMVQQVADRSQNLLAIAADSLPKGLRLHIPDLKRIP
jgi:tetratricopeptide (TPR) repeat protein